MKDWNGWAVGLIVRVDGAGVVGDRTTVLRQAVLHPIAPLDRQ